MSQGGLPQLDTALYPEQLFWLATSFALLYALMAYVALPAVRRTQERRAELIATELNAATAASDQAKTMIAGYEKALADARAEAQATISKTALEAAKDAAEKQAFQQRKLAVRLAEAERKIALSRDKAIREIRDAAIDLASSIIEKMMKTRLDSIAVSHKQ